MTIKDKRNLLKKLLGNYVLNWDSKAIINNFKIYEESQKRINTKKED